MNSTTTKNNTTTIQQALFDRVNDERELTPEEYTFLNIVGTDLSGRTIKECDYYKEGNRYVGIWYSLWLGQHQYMQTAIYDNTELLKDPESAEHLATNGSFEDTRMEEFHFCAKPLYGYYNMKDEWVIRRHIELLTLAGIDYLSLDTTNSIVYPDVAKKLFDILMEYQNQGFKVPKVMFYVNSNSGTTAKKIYNEFYQTEKYDDIWFSPNGKPLLAGVTKDSNGASDQTMGGRNDDPISEELRDRFEIVESQWPQGTLMHDNSIPWMDWSYPQTIHENYKAVSVSVAQHDPAYINFSHMGDWSSRGYNHETGIRTSEFARGDNFESEWKAVFNYEKQGKEIENVLVCGWNEWMAIKTWNGNETCFCDVYTDEYSRDIEMMDGATKDTTYLQLLRNIREYKCTEANHYKYQKMTIDLDDASLSQWDIVKAHYKDFNGDAIERNYENAVGTETYTDNSNRNDITDIKVTHNSKYLYIYVKTKENITEYTSGDKSWMNILINTNKGNDSFEGYDYIINRNPNSNGKTSVEKSTGGFNFNEAGEAEYRVYGDVILYRIPLEALGLTSDNCYILFKVFDNVTKPEDIMDYYVSGDSAPIGRLSYSYGY